MSHPVELRYSLLRYLLWVIPTIGFIGTVVRIAWTLAEVDPSNPHLGALTGSLAVAFNTPLVALLPAAVLIFVILGIDIFSRSWARLERPSFGPGRWRPSRRGPGRPDRKSRSRPALDPRGRKAPP